MFFLTIYLLHKARTVEILTLLSVIPDGPDSGYGAFSNVHGTERYYKFAALRIVIGLVCLVCQLLLVPKFPSHVYFLNLPLSIRPLYSILFP